MAEFKLGRLRFIWKGAWSPTTQYIRDDIVRVSGKTFVCLIGHTSDSNFYTDLENNPTRWNQVSDGSTWRDEWTAGEFYNVNDIVKYGAVLYICTQGHEAAATDLLGLEADLDLGDSTLTKWDIYAESFDWKDLWVAGTRYKLNDLVKYNGITYVCTEGHSAAATDTLGLEADQSKWDAFTEGFFWRNDVGSLNGTWAPLTRYRKNDVVRYGGQLYVCNTGHTAAATDTLGLEADQSKWDYLHKGIEYLGTWDNSSVRYKINDVVKYGGGVWICIDEHTSSVSTSFEAEETAGRWQQFVEGLEFENSWSDSTIYQPGDIVSYGGFAYVAITNNTNQLPTATTGTEWDLFSTGFNFRNDWATATEYKVGDVIRFNGYTYVAITDNTASTGNQPPSAVWERLNSGFEWKNTWSSGVFYRLGDSVKDGSNSYVCINQHTSTTGIDKPANDVTGTYWNLLTAGNEVDVLTTQGDLAYYGGAGPTRLAIGAPGEILKVSNGLAPEWEYWGVIDKIYYVAPNGVDSDDPERGITLDKPWATVRYATERITGPATINIKTGIYFEVLPIIVPAGVALVGDELRSTEIQPANSLVASGDVPYSLAALGRLEDIISDIITNTSFVKSSGNPLNQDTTGTSGGTTIGSAAALLLSDAQDYIDFRINDTGSLPATTGSNSASTDADRVNAIARLEANREFLKEEAVAFVNNDFPLYAGTYDEDACKRDVSRYIDALKYDLINIGNYKTLLSARYYVNAVLGSTAEDMFYVRNGTGIRNMTVKGLAGSLGTPNEYGTSRPTAGSFVSLDPGWGPDDESVWITTRSPYVQNVTTFGTGCVGQKIDGSLHNGGNRSIVSNDFTQILSDGIGAWITNNGLAELVSVFSYYGHIGYLAENGGKIRATNGNSSYGTFGCVAEGVDSDEVPVTARVNNRAGEALVGLVVTDNNRLLRLEYKNAGVNYTSANFTINGAGVNASLVGDEIRDDGVFDVRLTELVEDEIGGFGYLTAANAAQGGSTTTITLAATDQAISTAYVGMRLIITSGKGVGQTGYIQSYNSGSKVAEIYKESTGTAGWDHIIPGTPIETFLDLTTAYIIEPRITFTAPSFLSTGTTQVNNTWFDTAWAAVNASYTNVAAGGGAGTLATFNVTRNGVAYDTVTINAAGSDYVVGNTLTLLGTSLGGISTTNDISILVTNVNLSGAITQFEYTGVGSGGAFVSIPSTGSDTQRSIDGTTWTAGGALPTSASWQSLAYGAVAGVSTLVAIDSSTLSARSVNAGTSWVAGGTTSSAAWNTVAYGNQIFMKVADAGQTAISINGGDTWTSTTTLPALAGGSTAWTSVAYGGGKWVAIASGGTQAASSTNNGTIWTARSLPVSAAWKSVIFGNNRFIAIAANGTASAYSLDGETWYSGGATASSGTPAWEKVRYGQGLFFAVATATATAASSEDGIIWTTRTLSASNTWNGVAFGNPSTVGTWVATTTGSTTATRINAGATTKARCVVSDDRIQEFRIVEPGSGYTSSPTITITDPNNTTEATTSVRKGKGVLANPTFVNRGSLYATAVAEVTGNGTIDIYQNGTFVSVKGLSSSPVPGSNIQFDGDPTYYKLVTVRELLGTGPFTARLQISPPMTVAAAPEHETDVTMRIKYSQVRLTGHDFLSIGTGNFTSTNYPNLPLQPADPENETVESGGGRVFYTSTDQDGNFRVGTLFSVEQATGVATLNADAFNIAGLNELSLGAVALGGSGATITEFSTDPFFTADSDSVVPTQRAIKAYITAQIGSGSSQLNVNTLTAGQVFISNNVISTTTGVQINVPSKMNFTGGIDGVPVAMNFFLLG
jgi:hypothetical protein